MEQGDRVRLISETATYGTVIGNDPVNVAVKLDDGRAVSVERQELATLT
ncbi:hypothetical protein P0W64_02435 [Tsukamurella sp. 8F]|nr:MULTISPECIES: hypothetical protein [unclassified Tsukamurella]MDF0528664.1 hypothetical protein [Tsukamurella sp. 8J]MDF0585626.1 hypothetical protein [Tsukamurella sp. 8F]